MSYYGDIGPFVDRRTVERSVLTHVRKWLPWYLARVEAAHDDLPKRSLPLPKSWRVRQEFRRNPEDSLPMLAVVSPGLAPGNTAGVDGDGNMKATWAVAIGVIVHSKKEQLAKDLAGYYGVALRLLMIQIPTLGGFASGVTLEDERYDDMPSILERSLAATRVVFAIEVPEIANVYQGMGSFDEAPLEPPEDPYESPSEYPDIQSIQTDWN